MNFLQITPLDLGGNNLRLGLGILLAFACMPGHERIKIKFGYTSTGWWEVEPDPVIKREEPHWQAIKSKLYENGEQILNGLACCGMVSGDRVSFSSPHDVRSFAETREGKE